MPSPHGKIVVPTWVPDAVKKWALDEMPAARFLFNDEKEKEMLRRLLTDKRMRRVWRELTRHKRNSYRTTDKPFHQPDRSTTLCQKKGAECLAVNVGKGIWSCHYCGLVTGGPPKDIEQKPFPFDRILIGFLFWSCRAPLPVLTNDEIVKLSNEIKMFSYSLGGPQLGLRPS